MMVGLVEGSTDGSMVLEMVGLTEGNIDGLVVV